MPRVKTTLGLFLGDPDYRSARDKLMKTIEQCPCLHGILIQLGMFCQIDVGHTPTRPCPHQSSSNITWLYLTKLMVLPVDLFQHLPVHISPTSRTTDRGSAPQALAPQL